MNLNPSDVIKRPRFLTSPKRPGYDIDFHPRAFNKPLDCQVGKHPLPLKRIIGPGGIPHLYCTKCGSSIAEGLFTGTWSKDDIQHLSKIKQTMYSAQKYGKPKTKREMMEEAWRKHQESRSQRRERMGASIEKFVHDRLLDQ